MGGYKAENVLETLTAIVLEQTDKARRRGGERGTGASVWEERRKDVWRQRLRGASKAE